jgi:hypothetical protein
MKVWSESLPIRDRVVTRPDGTPKMPPAYSERATGIEPA